jgi:hypothetical protein
MIDISHEATCVLAGLISSAGSLWVTIHKLAAARIGSYTSPVNPISCSGTEHATELRTLLCLTARADALAGSPQRDSSNTHA